MIGTGFELLANLVQIFIWTWFITRFFGFKHNGISLKLGFIIMWFTGFAEISFINHIVVYDGFLSGLITFSYVIYARCCLKGSFFSQVFVSLFSTAIIFTIASITIFFFSYLSGLGTEYLIAAFNLRRIIIICICRILEVFVFKFMININSEYALTKKEWFLFITMPLLT